MNKAQRNTLLEEHYQKHFSKMGPDQTDLISKLYDEVVTEMLFVHSFNGAQVSLRTFF
jgi:hypothetical protein